MKYSLSFLLRNALPPHNSNQNNILKIKSLIILFLVVNINILKSQNPPSVEWQYSYWPNQNPWTGSFTNQNNSGEDWIFDLRLNRDNLGNVDGFICSGYSTFLNQEASANPYGCVNCIDLVPAYDQFEDQTHRKGCNKGKLIKLDLQGNKQWYKTYSTNYSWFNTAIQTSDHGYLAVGVTQDLDKYYNPTSALPTNSFVCGNDINRRHIYIVKTDANGNVQWEYIYGYSNNLITALDSRGEAWDVVEMPNGNYKVVGSAEVAGFLQIFLIELYPNGYIHWTGLYGVSGVHSMATRIARSPKPGPVQYAIVGNQYTNSTNTIQEAFCMTIGDGSNPLPLHKRSLAGTGSGNAAAYDITYDAAGNNILVPAIVNCSNCQWPRSQGKGMIIKLAASDLHKVDSYPIGIIPLGGSSKLVKAYDLRVGITNTADGGFAAISSVQTVRIPDNTPPYANPLWTTNLNYPYFDKEYWNTDTYVAKFNSAGVLEWEKVFDTKDLIPTVFQYPYNVKRQECLYHILETPDGGLAICGNDGNNFDDDYVAKLYSDCIVTQPYTIVDATDNIIDINANTTWNGNQKVLGSVRINNGATLSIGAGAVIEFADSKQSGIVTNIDVQVGGQLKVLSGAVMTSIQACPNSMWDGIVIRGTSLKQLPVNQGKVVLTSCRIENARKGATTLTFNGGILQASHTTFRNNFIDVELMPYSAPLTPAGYEQNNLSHFNQCNFIGDAFLNDPTYVFPLLNTRLTSNMHVILRGVKGIQFSGCNFKTDLTGILGSNYLTDFRSYGIYSVDASFNVRRACNIIHQPTGECAGVQCNFENLYYGIHAQSTNPLKTFSVDQTKFINCYYSLFQSGIDYSVVTKNTFTIYTILPSTFLPGCPVQPCANYFDYLNNCHGFTHSQNTFTVTGGQNVIGTIFNSTGTSNNISYRNAYTGLRYGTQIQGINGISSSSAGLQIKCNMNTSVLKSDMIATSGVLPDQGTCATDLSMANNIFSHNTLPEGDISLSASASSFIYNFAPNPFLGPQYPINKTATVSSNGCPNLQLPFNYASSCPLPSTGCNIPCLYALAVTNNALAIAELRILIAGDTLSQARKERGFRNKIKTAQKTNLREHHEALRQHYDTQRELAINSAMSLLLTDTTMVNIDIEMEKFLNLSTAIKSKENLVLLYQNRGDHGSAQRLIDSLHLLPKDN